MSVLKIFTLSHDILGNEVVTPFPNESHQIEIDNFEYSSTRMGGAPLITAKFKHELCLDDMWTEKQFVEFNGLRFFVRDTPSSSKDNTDARYEHDVTFLHERAVLENVYMIDSVHNGDEEAQPQTDKYVSNSTKVVFWGNITEFVGRFNACLKHAKLGDASKEEGYYVVIDSDVPEEDLTKEVLVSFEDKFFSEALQEIYNTYNIPFYWVGKVCHVGNGLDPLEDYVFEYGSKNELLAIEKQNSNQGYCNRATGVGSSDNLPYYYPNLTTPDATIPHAVVGNKGITSDSHLSITDKAVFANAKPELESVNLIGEESPDSWQGKALRFLSGVGRNALVADVENIYREYYSYDYDGDGRSDDGEYYERQSRAKYKIRPNETVKTIGGYSEEEINNFHNDAIKDYENGLVVAYIPEVQWRVYSEGKSWQPLGYVMYARFRVDRSQSCARVTFRFKVSYEGDNRAIGVTAVEAISSNSRIARPLSNIYVTPVVQTTDKEIDSDGFLNSIFEVFGLDTLDKDEIWFRITYTLKDKPTQREHTPLRESGDRVCGSRYKMVWLNFKTPLVENVADRWYREDSGDLAQFDYNYRYPLSHWGLSSSVQPKNGDRIVRLYVSDTLSKIVPVSTLLMPTIYRDTDGEESFYNAYDNPTLYERFYKNEQGENYDFEHEFHDTNPREGKFDFPDIMPTIKGMKNPQGKALDQFVAVAFDKTDSDNLKDNIFTPVVDDEGNTIQDNQSKDSSEYAHPYFFAKLPKTNTDGGHQFNLFACAITDGTEMTISMTSGQCGGCNFTVMVDEETKKNPVLVCKSERRAADGTVICSVGEPLRDDDGTVLFAGDQKAKALGYVGFQEEQQDTDGREVWVCLKKETETYGIIMPNASSNLRPKASDSFVILNINLPLAYVTDAEDRLSKAIIKAMWENNFEKFNFSIKLSRIFCEQNRRISSMISENAILHIKYNGRVIPLYVNSYSYKSDSGILPEISVDLSGNISVGTAFSQNRQSSQSMSVPQIITGGILPIIVDGSDAEPTDENVYSAKKVEKDFISKKRNDSTPYDLSARNMHSENVIRADDFVESKNGYRTQDYTQGVVGARKGVYADAEGNLYVKNLFVEESMTVPSISYSRAMVMFGIFIVAPAAGKILEVSPDTDAEGNFLKSGWITLDLEDGEYGSVDFGDMLLGFWHNMNENNDENQDGTWDEEKGVFVRDGNYKMKGFNSIYFLVDRVDEDYVDGSRLHYQLRGASDDTWVDRQHPAKGMSFFGFGNINDPNRQSIYIITREYNVRVVNKNTWTFGTDNIVSVEGKLDGFSMNAVDRNGNPYVKWFSGYGRVGGNEYIFGSIDQFERVAYSISVEQELGGYMAEGEEQDIVFRCRDAYGADVSDKIQRIKIERSTSDGDKDAEWNAAHTDVNNPYRMRYSDIGSDKVAVFNIEVSVEGEATPIHGMFAVRKAETGESPVLVSVFSRSGSFQIPKGGNVTLYAVVTKDGVDITDTIDPNFFSWVRSGKDSALDEIWNEQHQGVGREITLLDSDVDRMAAIDCIVVYDNN